MDSSPVGGTPTPPPDLGFDADDAAQLLGKSPIRRTEANPGPTNVTTTEHVRVNDRPGPNAPDWLDPPSFSEDVDIAGVMIALHQAGVTLRTAMHEAQQAARDAQVAATKAEGQDIRNSAMLSFGAALAAGVGQIAGGALDIGGAADAFRTAGFPDEDDAAGTTGTDKPALTDFDEMNDREMQELPKDPMEELLGKSKKSEQERAEDIRFKKADIRLKAWSGLSQVAVGLGQVGAAIFETESKQQDAAEKDDEAKALKAAAQVEDQDNLLKNIDDLIATTRQTFSQVIEARNEAINRITQA